MWRTPLKRRDACSNDVTNSMEITFRGVKSKETMSEKTPNNGDMLAVLGGVNSDTSMWALGTEQPFGECRIEMRMHSGSDTLELGQKGTKGCCAL